MIDDTRNWMASKKMPVTIGICASQIVLVLFWWFLHYRNIDRFVFALDGFRHPWTLITYPWAWAPLASTLGPLWFAVALGMMVRFGGEIEKSMGSARYAAFVTVVTALPAIILGLAAMALGISGGLVPQPILYGPWVPGAAVLVAWCARNRKAQMNLWGVLPLPATWLAILVSAGVLFTVGDGYPLLGVFACLHLILAWFFALDRLPIEFEGRRVAPKRAPEATIRGGVKYDESYYAEVKKREQEREERERLRKLFGESLEDDGQSR